MKSSLEEPQDLAADKGELTLKVSIKDQGIGMTPNELERVFEPFWKSSNLVSKGLNPTGNGVGLHICKEICHQLGGDIGVISTVGLGSVFTLTMKVFKEPGSEKDSIIA